MTVTPPSKYRRSIPGYPPRWHSKYPQKIRVVAEIVVVQRGCHSNFRRLPSSSRIPRICQCQRAHVPLTCRFRSCLMTSLLFSSNQCRGCVHFILLCLSILEGQSGDRSQSVDADGSRIPCHCSPGLARSTVHMSCRPYNLGAASPSRVTPHHSSPCDEPQTGFHSHLCTPSTT